MLQNLHVKNFALIDEADVDFTEGLNILSGETGAGKSIILGSLDMALGAKADKDSIRAGSEFALVELSFYIENDEIKNALKDFDVFPEDDMIVISRKITPGRSVFKINGETVTANDVKNIAGLLIDVYGQHDYQNLLKSKMHLDILDTYIGSELDSLMSEYREVYKLYLNIKNELAAPEIDEQTRTRTISLLEYQINEIESASLKVGEEEETESKLKILENSAKIREVLARVKGVLFEDEVSSSVGVDIALKEILSISQYDDKLSSLSDEISNVSDMLSDVSRGINDCFESMDVDDESLDYYRERYEVINELERKYGRTVSDVLSFMEEKKIELDNLYKTETKREDLIASLAKTEEKLCKLSSDISKLRKSKSLEFERDIISNLEQLNFLQCQFKVDINSCDDYKQNGRDNVTFLISTNPGEALKPINQIASGGELSRIMLAIKSVTASNDSNLTLIFDEIDSGISGVTAWKVAEKLGRLAFGHQIICITHLQQIASMADSHYLIMKFLSEEDKRTVSNVKKLDEEGRVKELVRMLGDDTCSELFINNAKEILARARDYKSHLSL